jgi:hypothetical protein
MITTLTKSVEQIISSQSGIHLTAYVAYDKNTIKFIDNIETTLSEARAYLKETMSKDEIESFLKPIKSALSDHRIIHKINGNIGIFRTKKSFRIVKIPVNIYPICTVSDSFHVKPLIKWLQSDKEFLIVRTTPGSASIYQGTLFTFKHLQTVLFSDICKSTTADDSIDAPLGVNLDEVMTWVSRWINKMTEGTQVPIYQVGHTYLAKLLQKKMNNSNVYTKKIWSLETPEAMDDVVQNIRKNLNNRISSEFKKKIESMKDVESYDSEISKIAKAAVEGKVERLVLAHDVNIFGKFDRNNGNMKISTSDTIFEDEDILDDIAQSVIKYGGEVILMNLDSIPNKKPAMAIIQSLETDHAKN